MHASLGANSDELWRLSYQQKLKWKPHFIFSIIFIQFDSSFKQYAIYLLLLFTNWHVILVCTNCSSLQNLQLHFIRNSVSLFFTGAYDQATEGRWRWVDCMDFNDFSTSNWASGQPSGNAGEDCGQLLPNGQFNDWPCERPVQYICQIVFKGMGMKRYN